LYKQAQSVHSINRPSDRRLRQTQRGLEVTPQTWIKGRHNRMLVIREKSVLCTICIPCCVWPM